MKEYYIYELYLEHHEKPFYVGKTYFGAYRLAQHRGDKYPSHKTRMVQKALREGHAIIERVVFRTHDEAAALDKERELILTYGRKDKKTGILVNHTDGGEGTSGIVSSVTKEVSAFTLTGKYIATYVSLTDAAKQLNLSKVAISQHLRQVRGPVRAKHSNTYYQFRYGISTNAIDSVAPKCPNKRIEAVCGNTLLSFISTTKAAKYFNVSPPTIQQRLKHKVLSPLIHNHMSWYFRYEDEIK